KRLKNLMKCHFGKKRLRGDRTKLKINIESVIKPDWMRSLFHVFSPHIPNTTGMSKKITAGNTKDPSMRYFFTLFSILNIG
ncbi:MAG: hypothetical protein KDK61_02540, partial [Simkania sp.]|nr:hypothetical protein [Simkania sp.]